MGFDRRKDDFGLGYEMGRWHATPTHVESYPANERSPVVKRMNLALATVFFWCVYFLGWAGYGLALAAFDIDMFWLIFAPFWPVILVGWILYEIFAEIGSESLDFLKDSKDFIVALYHALIA